MAAVRTGNVVIAPQRFTDAHGNRFLPDVEMSETRHLGAEIKLINLLFEQPDLQHLMVEMKSLVTRQCGRRLLRCRF